MRKILYLIFPILGLVATSCSRVSLDADEIGIFVMKPYVFGAGGVDETPLMQGATWKVASTDFIVLKKTPQKFTEGFDDIMSDDNTPVDLTANIILQIVPKDASKLISDFGEDWYSINIKPKFVKFIRDEISNYKMFDLTSNREVYDKIEAVVIQKVSEIIKEREMPIQVIDVVVDRAKPNPGVMEEIDRTAIQIQNMRTQSERVKAEEQRALAERAKAVADRAYMQEMRFSTGEYLKLREIEIEKEKIEMIRNKSQVNVTMLMGGGATPIYSVK